MKVDRSLKSTIQKNLFFIKAGYHWCLQQWDKASSRGLGQGVASRTQWVGMDVLPAGSAASKDWVALGGQNCQLWGVEFWSVAMNCNPKYWLPRSGCFQG